MSRKAKPYGLCTHCFVAVATHTEVIGSSCRRCCTCVMFTIQTIHHPGFTNVPTTIVTNHPTANLDHDAPMCTQCGILMVRTGTCHTCPDCGESGGCS